MSRSFFTGRTTMLRKSPLLIPLALSALLAACATRPYDRSNEPGAAPRGVTTSGSVVIAGDALKGDPTMTLLDAIRSAMPQVRTAGTADPSGCPTIELRGKDRITGDSNPTIYVDGVRAVDTCALTMIQAIDARLVEVYPLGVTSRAGYLSSPHGLILVFLQRADTISMNCRHATPHAPSRGAPGE
jgi:hypothetical protein